MPRVDGDLPAPKQRPVRMPSDATLRKYGVTTAEWEAILHRQGWVCAVCKKVPDNGRLCLDHEHVKGWKKMPAEERRKYVRGMLCYFCNHYYVGRAITVAKAQGVLDYLTAYEARKVQ